MKVSNKESSIIALKKEREQEMTELICPKCFGKKTTSVFRIDCTGDIEVKGIIRCNICQHELPFTMYRNYIQKLDIALPGAQSGNLHSSVPSDIQDDVKEAERANYAQCYKACVTMCRRALQLGLIDKGVSDAPLGAMLQQASGNVLKDQDLLTFAKTIKGFGDIGAHRRDELEPIEIDMVIYVTVHMLNELFP